MINIFNEYHFILTISDNLEYDRFERRYIVKAYTRNEAWTRCMTRALRHLREHESLEKIELIEVE